ncbi:hypothetical protein SKAU_G00141130 [Synaphobranchus kaupii]|uniref:Uncharacterized protein n=1 Tax=Synaphobranchus kaupii TaxID=118154 RepID=A0A9Q1J259_SYNKA|nr:hypothetical protein SKAU_G00141130 [Synaphobranchus kaupii]
MREDGNQKLERLLAEQSKVQQLEGKFLILEQDQIVLQNEKMHLELQSNIMQEKLDAKDLPQDMGSTLLTSDSEHHDKESEVKDVIQSQKQTKETEQERKKTDAILKIQMEFHKKQAEGNLISARIAEHTLAAESKDNAILRQKIIEVRAQLSEIQNPVFAPPLKKGSWLREKLEQHVKEIKSGGRKEEIRNFKQRIQEINEKHERTQSGLKKQVVARASENALTIKRKEMASLSKRLSEASAKVAGYQEPLTEALSRSDLQIRPLRKYGAVPTKNVNTVDKSGQLKNMNELCQKKDQALQQKAAQGDSERRDKELKVKDVRKTHKLKVQAIQEQHQKSELSYMAEVNNFTQHKY